ncbi:MAG: response regulator [Candidatus Gorgyraea atricola]|nr:response regulator [Candidatus Gorgyraea atricola]
MARILIIDDDKLIRDAFKSVLEKFDHNLDFAKTAKEGMDLFKPKKYNLVFLDLALPDKDGQELLKDFRVIDKDTKICVISGFLSKLGNLLEQHDQAVANTVFCMKPINREEVMKIVEEAIAG